MKDKHESTCVLFPSLVLLITLLKKSPKSFLTFLSFKNHFQFRKCKKLFENKTTKIKNKNAKQPNYCKNHTIFSPRGKNWCPRYALYCIPCINCMNWCPSYIFKVFLRIEFITNSPTYTFNKHTIISVSIISISLNTYYR